MILSSWILHHRIDTSDITSTKIVYHISNVRRRCLTLLILKERINLWYVCEITKLTVINWMPIDGYIISFSDTGTAFHDYAIVFKSNRSRERVGHRRVVSEC